ncbi:Methyltransferase FkbM domain-containing protein [Selenomonas sp. KH1T6]|nr:Methyltransferase FkbM domain-containing protein [Selenomonas ruminantium]
MKGFIKRILHGFLDKLFRGTEACRTIRQIEANQARMEALLLDIQKAAGSARDNAGHCDYLMQSFMGNWQTEVMSRYEDISSSKIARHISSLRSLLQVKRPSAKSGRLIRTGNANDGGYVMLDNMDGSKVAYSIGICDDVTWDSFMAERGFDVYMYDHTIEGLPEENPRFHWQKIGLGGIYDEQHPELRTLPMLLEDNGHLGQKHMILKMDIEGAEWSCFSNLEEAYLEQFDQILLELHDMNDLSRHDEMLEVLAKLNKTHQLVHIHGNNCDVYTMVKGMVMPNFIEVTYLKRDLYDFEEWDGCFPDELDFANNQLWPDIFLGRWK